MRTSVILLAGLATLGGFLIEIAPAHAVLTLAQRRELRKLETEIRRVNALIDDKDFDAAGKKLKEVEDIVAKIQKEAMVTDKDRAIAGLKRAIALQRIQLAKAKPQVPNDPNAKPTVSFTKDVLPILTKNCGGCHGATGNAKANLRLSSFENLKKGGGSGPLLTIGNANQSLIVRRITGTGNVKMPPGNRPALSNEDVQTLIKWINEGAKDDTGNPNVGGQAQGHGKRRRPQSHWQGNRVLHQRHRPVHGQPLHGLPQRQQAARRAVADHG